MNRTITPSSISNLIHEAESLLLKDGEHFDCQTREFIRCLEKKDIVACPGSGKTTALVAKLFILSKFMPFDDGSGICVLTHTNVAVDIIKERLGKRASKLFEHPNFIGTIQCFVDKFLAQPYYLMRYHHRITSIDDDIAYGYIIHRLRNWGAVRQRPYFLKSLKDIRFNFENHEIIDKKGKPFPYNPFDSSDSYIKIEIIKRKNNAIQKGILFFDEAYNLAFQHINKSPIVIEALCERFKYIYIDEEQDNNMLQDELVSTVFRDSILQKIKDPNQTIFDSINDITQADNEGRDNNDQSVIRIPISKRISKPIADAIRDISVYPEHDLSSSTGVRITPKMIFYSDTSSVLPKFKELIRAENLHIISNKGFKAVGFVGKKDMENVNKIVIPSYFPSYRKPDKKRMVFDSLREYILTPLKLDKCMAVKPLSDAIINSILRMLYLAEKGDPTQENRPFYKTGFLNFLEKNYPDEHSKLSENLSKWSRRMIIHKCNDTCTNGHLPYPTCVYDDIIVYAKDRLFPLLGVDYAKTSDFINKDLADDFQRSSRLNNIYPTNGADNDIRIEIGTVHSVKGETHTATLFLDTKWHDYEANRLKNFFMQRGNDRERNQTRKKKALHIIYVAMSRPTHLLCVAFKLPEGQAIRDYWLRKPQEERLWDIVDC